MDSKQVLSSDVRSLAVFRIGLGIILILDILIRMRDIAAHYTSSGVYPLSLLDNVSVWEFISIYRISDNFWFVACMFIVSLIFALMLLLGYKTKLATIVSWFFLISIQTRNPLVLHGGDILLRVIMFWAMFLPLDKIWALDSRKKSEKRILSIGSVGILFQVCFLYFFAAVLKSGKEWFPDGTAIYYALSIDQFVTKFGLILYNYPIIMNILTYFVLFYWYFGVILLIIPFFFPYARIIAISIYAILQIGMGTSMHLGLFPLISIVATLPLVPSYFWDDLLKKIKTTHEFTAEVKNEFNFNNKLKIFVFCLGLFFILYGFVWNIDTVYDFMSENSRIPGYITRMDQKWDMFSPYPLKDDGWYVISGTLLDGRSVDVIHGGSVSFAKPLDVSATYPNTRWRKYMMNIWSRRYSFYRQYYASYLCGQWNSEHGGSDRLTKVEVIFMREDTLPNYETAPIKKISTIKYNCE